MPGPVKKIYGGSLITTTAPEQHRRGSGMVGGPYSPHGRRSHMVLTVRTAFAIFFIRGEHTADVGRWGRVGLPEVNFFGFGSSISGDDDSI